MKSINKIKSSTPHWVAFLFVLMLTGACSNQKQPIVNPADYSTYLESLPMPEYDIDVDIKFWHERLTKMPNDYASQVKLAGLHSALFRRTGDVRQIHYSDSIYLSLLESPSTDKAKIHLALAQNAITQHQFKKAWSFTQAALDEGELKPASLMVMADVKLELGDLQGAKNILRQFTNKNSFAHRIRQVKVKDQQGELDSAIYIMEQAFDRVKGNKDLFCWSLSNLGDMYGHAGRIEDAYRAYLNVLKKEPNYDYALKGIAWIALSHDKNLNEAKRIIAALAARSRMPEAHLMLAEIAELENDKHEKSNQLAAFVRMTDTPTYHTMYAKYLANIFAEDLNQPEKSLAIAESEIANRPTPQSYDLKAWALLHLGREKEALVIAQNHVVEKTFEPEAAYHLGMIYKANGFEKEAEKYLEHALESSFELGPSVTHDIQKALKTR